MSVMFLLFYIFLVFSSSAFSSSGSSAVLSFSQSSPSCDIVCPGDTLVFTCITSYESNIESVSVLWAINNQERSLNYQHYQSRSGPSLNGFTFSMTKINDTASTVTSTATNVSVTLELNGTAINCSGDAVHFSNTLTVHIAGVPVSVINIKIIPINNNTVLMNWYYEKNDEVHCIQYYNITIISDDKIEIQMISNESSTTISSLIIGINYSFIIIPIDTIGREGPPSSLIQYIWNIPAQVVNISWDQISNDGITILWNNNEDVTLHYPPVHYIVSVHNITINTTDNTNVTINGLYPNNEYTVYIKPVNAIGEGPLINITVNITEYLRKTTSTYVPVSVTGSLSDVITSSSNDKFASMSISLTIIDNTLVSETSSVEPPSTTPPNSRSMNSSLLFSIFGVIGAVVISIIAVILTCIMYRRKHNSVKKKKRDINDYTEFELRSTNNHEVTQNSELQHTGLESYTVPGQSIESQYSVIRKGDMMKYEEVPPPIPPPYNYNENGQSPMYSTVNKNQVNNDRQGPVYSTVNKNQVPVKSANKVLVYADVMIVPKDSRPQCPPTSVQPVTYAVI